MVTWLGAALNFWEERMANLILPVQKWWPLSLVIPPAPSEEHLVLSFS